MLLGLSHPIMMTRNCIVVKFIYGCTHVKLFYVAKTEINLLTYVNLLLTSYLCRIKR